MNYLQPTWQLSGMTCSFAEPESVKTIWAFEAYKLLHEFQVHLADLEVQVKKPALLKLTRKRLENLILNIREQIVFLEKLLEPLGWRKIQEKSLISYFTDYPEASVLAGNYDNLFRDWVWGEGENKAALDFVMSVVDVPREFDKVLVLGAGGCRLAYDFHVQLKPKKTVVCDFNPLLMLVAQKVIRGSSVSLIEFPLMPAKAEFSALQRKLSAPEVLPSAEEFEFILADATQSTFSEGSFDTIITPWLIDVVKTDLSDFLALINQILPMGGSWISFGPLGFNNPILSSHYSLEEVKYLIEKSGFQISAEKYEMIPYMQNPSSNSHRTERVLTLSATKVKSVERPEKSRQDQEFAWEIDKDSPIQIPVKEMNLVKGHTFNAEVLTLVQAGASFSEVVASIASKHTIPEDQAIYLASHILYNAEAATHRNPLRR